MLKDKPKHWMGYFDGSLWANLESPRGFKPCDMTADQIREINAYTHIENELIDDACARVFDCFEIAAGRRIPTSFSPPTTASFRETMAYCLLGAYVDSLMRLPLIWRPAPNANIPAAEVTAPVGHLDLAQTFCQIAGIGEPDWVEGKPLPVSEQDAQTAATPARVDRMGKRTRACEPQFTDHLSGRLGLLALRPKLSVRRHRGGTLPFVRGPGLSRQSVGRPRLCFTQERFNRRPRRQPAQSATAQTAAAGTGVNKTEEWTLKRTQKHWATWRACGITTLRWATTILSVGILYRRPFRPLRKPVTDGEWVWSLPPRHLNPMYGSGPGHPTMLRQVL